MKTFCGILAITLIALFLIYCYIPKSKYIKESVKKYDMLEIQKKNIKKLNNRSKHFILRYANDHGIIKYYIFDKSEHTCLLKMNNFRYSTNSYNNEKMHTDEPDTERELLKAIRGEKGTIDISENYLFDAPDSNFKLDDTYVPKQCPEHDTCILISH